jgi:hypothetical protein
MSTHENRGRECALLRATPESGAERQDPDRSANRLTRGDRAIITRYFDGAGSVASVTRFAQSSKLRRRWMIGGKLPATLRTDALPRELECQLSTLQPGFKRLLVGGAILCIEHESSRIVDIMHNAGAAATPDTAQLLVDDGANHAAGSTSGP